MAPRTTRAPPKPAKPRAKPAKSPRAKAVAATGGSQTDPAVLAFLRELEHPLADEINAVREIILGASPDIREEIKWNAPSFRTSEFFATFNLRSKEGVRLVFHTGAKVKASAKDGLQLADPAGLVEWLAKDRGLVTLGDAKDIKAKRTALRALVREWISILPK
jgi:hypothetical protein